MKNDFEIVPSRSAALEDEPHLEKESVPITEPMGPYEDFIEKSQDIIYWIDAQGFFTYVNAAAERIMGYPKKDLLGCHYLTLIRPDYHEIASRTYGKQLAHKILDTYLEFPAITKDGREIWVGQWVQMVKAGETIRGFRAIARDITKSKKVEENLQKYQNNLEKRLETLSLELKKKNKFLEQEMSERRQLESALLESQERYRSVLDNIEEGYYETDLKGNFISINNAFAEIHGYSKTEMMGMTFRQFTDAQNSRKIYQMFNGVYRTGRHCKDSDYEITHRSGKKVILETSISLKKNSSGVPTGFLGIIRDITERKEAEKQIRHSEMQFRVQYQNNPLPIVTWKRVEEDFILIDCNQAAISATDGKITQLIGKKAGELFQGRPDLIQSYERCFQEQTVFTEELVSELFLPGRMIVTTLGYIPPDLLLLHFRDITRRKEAEERLRLANRRLEDIVEFLQSMIDSIPNPIFYKDTAGKYLGCNKAFADMLGRNREEIIGKTSYDLSPEDLAKRYHEMDQRLFNQPGVQVYEASVLYPDGNRHEVIFNKATFGDKDGIPAGLIGVIIDITERKKAEEVIQKTHQRIALLLNSISSILIAVNKDDRVVFWNTKAALEFGISGEEAEGKPLMDLGIQWDREQISKAISRCRFEKLAVGLKQTKFLQQSGKDGWLGIRLSPVLGVESTEGMILIQGANITKRRILESQLAQAQKLESIGQLAAGIAHEINTPTQYVGDNVRFLQTSFDDLLNILGQYGLFKKEYEEGRACTQLLEKIEQIIAEIDLDYLTEEIPKAIQQTLDGVDRVSRIVQSMKAFSHPGKEEKILYDLNKAIENTLVVTRNEWKYFAEVATDLEPSLPLIPCIPGVINQVFLNILVNAAQAIAEVVGSDPGRKGTITITTHQVDRWVEIRISDTGEGIPEDIRSKIFDPFFTTKEVGKGTGQGLAISHTAVVEKHQGSIAFTTEINQGTTFIIRLPIEEDRDGR